MTRKEWFVFFVILFVIIPLLAISWPYIYIIIVMLLQRYLADIGDIVLAIVFLVITYILKEKIKEKIYDRRYSRN